MGLPPVHSFERETTLALLQKWDFAVVGAVILGAHPRPKAPDPEDGGRDERQRPAVVGADSEGLEAFRERPHYLGSRGRRFRSFDPDSVRPVTEEVAEPGKAWCDC